MSTLHSEDLAIGWTIDLGTYTAGEAEIIEFAQQWDPQAFHTDPLVAAAGFFGEVIASGIHSLAIYQRLAVMGAYQHWAVIAGRRIKSVELTAPLRPDMTVAGDLTILAVENTRPDRALVVTRGRLRNGPEPVLDLVVESYVRRRSS